MAQLLGPAQVYPVRNQIKELYKRGYDISFWLIMDSRELLPGRLE